MQAGWASSTGRTVWFIIIKWFHLLGHRLHCFIAGVEPAQEWFGMDKPLDPCPAVAVAVRSHHMSGSHVVEWARPSK